MKEELELISQIYFEINISEHSDPDFIKQRLRSARKNLNELSGKLRKHGVTESFYTCISVIGSFERNGIYYCKTCKNKKRKQPVQ